jgi:hypothetical protein
MNPEDFIKEVMNRMTADGLTAQQAVASVNSDLTAIKKEMLKIPLFALPPDFGDSAE